MNFSPDQVIYPLLGVARSSSVVAVNSALATRNPHSTLRGASRVGRAARVGRVARVAVTGGIAAIASLGLMSAANAQNNAPINALEAFQVVAPPLVPAPTAAPTPASVLDAVVTTAAPTTAAPSTKAPVVIVPTALGNSIVAAPAIKSEVLGKTLTSPAFTGSNAIAMALAGAVLFGFGSVLVLSARRRTKTR